MNKKKTPNTHLYFVDTLRTAIERDWGGAVRIGLRNRAYSQDSFQKDLRRNYPDVGNSTMLKTVASYVTKTEEDGKPRSIDEIKVKRLLRYIFIDNNDIDWKNVKQAIRDFQGGMYMDWAAPYVLPGQKDVDAVIPANQAVEAGATPGEDYYMQMLQLTMKAKEKFAKMEKELSEKKQELNMAKKQNKHLEDTNEAQAKRIRELEDLITVIEAKMEMLGSDTPQELIKQVAELKKELKAMQ